MGRPRKNLEQLNDIEDTGLIYSTEAVEAVEEVIIEDIHTKYQKFINQAKEGYIVGFEYPMAMEVLRYCERKRNTQFGLNLSCASCLIDMLKMFDNLRD